MNQEPNIEELFPRKGRDSPTFNEQQVPCCNLSDSSANSVLKDRDCARAVVQLFRKLVDLFYPLVELTLFDAAGKIEEIDNAFSTRKEDQECDVANSPLEQPFQELLASGRTVRSLLYPLRSGKNISGYLRLRYDLTHFKNLQEQLHFLVQPAEDFQERGTTEQWRESIDQLFLQYFAENKSNIQAATQKQKRELIAKLQERGLFDFKESSAYVARKLQISRATVYNYLKTTSHFKKVHVHQVDAFTNERFGGNPAGVVLDADELDEASMRKIARELNLSETAFILPSKKSDFQMRYFTPTGHEISFCGHSTVGALYMIAKERRFGIENEGNHTFRVETSCGVLTMETTIDKKGEIRVAYETPLVRFKESKITHQQVAEAAGFDVKWIDLSHPVMVEETNKDLFVTIKSLEHLKKIECDAKGVAQLSKQHDLVALCLFCPKAFAKKNQFHMRCFAPLVGIPEDPFTGSVLGGLTAYVDTFGLLPKGQTHFRVEQGHFLERPGVVEISFSKKAKKYHVQVYAQAVHCFSTEINLT